MSKVYSELYYHLVWATWRRHPFLKVEIQGDLYRYIAHKCKAYGFHVYAVNGMEEHMHLVVRLAPTVSVAEAIRKVKGSSSRFCNTSLALESKFKWQEGYGVLTFGKRDLSGVVAYVENQKVRHQAGRLNATFEIVNETSVQSPAQVSR